MTDTANLGLPCIEGSQAQKHVTHNEALRLLDTLVQLAVVDRDLTAPPGAPADGESWIVKTGATGAWAGHADQIASWQDGVWQFSTPRIGWLAYAIDESALIAWDGSAWVPAIEALTPTALNNMTLVGVGTTADTTNPLSAKLNNALFTARTVAEGGDGDLRYKLSKESAARTLSFLFQDNYSGRAEIGLTGDDDFHFKVSADGSAWIDALVLDKSTGAARINSSFHLTGDIAPAQIAANQNDYNPAGLSGASVLRLNSDASRDITGLSGGGDGRILTLINTGSFPIVLKNDDAGSSAANRFDFGAHVTLAAKQAAVIWYDSAASHWRPVAAPASAGGDVPADLPLLLGQLALSIADNANVAQFLGEGGNRFADSFDALTYVDTGAAINLNTGTAGILKPSSISPTLISQATGTAIGNMTSNGGLAAAFDGTTSQALSACATIAASSGYVGKNYSASPKYIDSAVVYGSSDSGMDGTGAASNITLTLYGKNGSAPGSATDGTSLATATFADANGNNRTLTSSAPGTAWDYVWVRAATDTSGTTAIAEVRFYEPGTLGNLTVTSTALTAASAPSTARLVARVKEVDAIALNTDLIFSASRDGGTTWTAFAMTKQFTANAIAVYDSDDLDLSAQPSGTSVKWKIASANDKLFEIHDIYLYWS